MPALDILQPSKSLVQKNRPRFGEILSGIYVCNARVRSLRSNKTCRLIGRTTKPTSEPSFRHSIREEASLIFFFS